MSHLKSPENIRVTAQWGPPTHTFILYVPEAWEGFHSLQRQMKSARYSGGSSSKNNCTFCMLLFFSNQTVLYKPQSQLTQATELFLLPWVEICDAAWMLQACICLVMHCLWQMEETSSNEEMGYKYNDRVTELFVMSVCCISIGIKL